jgi:hypothetical protein
MPSSLSGYVPLLTGEEVIVAEAGLCTIQVINQMSNMYKFDFKSIFQDASQVDCQKFNEKYGDCFISGSSFDGLDLDISFIRNRLYCGGRFHRSCLNEGSGYNEEDRNHNLVSGSVEETFATHVC